MYDPEARPVKVTRIVAGGCAAAAADGVGEGLGDGVGVGLGETCATDGDGLGRVAVEVAADPHAQAIRTRAIANREVM